MPLSWPWYNNLNRRVWVVVKLLQNMHMLKSLDSKCWIICHTTFSFFLFSFYFISFFLPVALCTGCSSFSICSEMLLQRLLLSLASAIFKQLVTWKLNGGTSSSMFEAQLNFKSCLAPSPSYFFFLSWSGKPLSPCLFSNSASLPLFAQPLTSAPCSRRGAVSVGSGLPRELRRACWQPGVAWPSQDRATLWLWLFYTVEFSCFTACPAVLVWEEGKIMCCSVLVASLQYSYSVKEQADTFPQNFTSWSGFDAALVKWFVWALASSSWIDCNWWSELLIAGCSCCCWLPYRLASTAKCLWTSVLVPPSCWKAFTGACCLLYLRMNISQNTFSNLTRCLNTIARSYKRAKW